MWDMTVGPGSMLTGRRACGIVQTRLGEDHVRCLSRLPCTGSLLRGNNFRQRTPQVHSGSAAARCGLPWDGVIEGPVHLEHRSTIAVACELPAIAFWQALAGQAQHLPRRDVKENGAG